MIASNLSSAVAVGRGKPSSLGATPSLFGINFAIHAVHADALTLRLYPPGSSTASHNIPFTHQTGTIWHLEVAGEWEGYEYSIIATRNKEEFELLDPYAKLVAGPGQWREKKNYKPRGVIHSKEFDWQGVASPSRPIKDLIIYEMHVRGFTADPSSGVAFPGTYKGLIEKIPYLQKLGINAVELLPIHEFWEGEYQATNPLTGEKLCNYWGYSTVNFFSPMTRYASDPRQAIEEFKMMVRELHRAGIEVILDVVFNHTSEGGEGGPTHSFRGFDPSYYLLGDGGEHLNFSGCGNTFNCNHPPVQNLILDSLRYWVSEMGVDGFRFDLASILGRGEGGKPLTFSPLIDRICHDPLLAGIKLIAEAWDAGGLYQVGNFYPEYGRWAEWNGRYRDVVRHFIKGTPDHTGPFATAICGSEDLYAGRSPTRSINFVTAHDGFTLRDLVSYQQKHNESNGEENRDGTNDNESWNCGIEGETADPKINALRQRQIRNFLSSLMLSQGVPMLCMGDEYGHTKKGNNNTWCQDNKLNWFQWEELVENGTLFQFTQELIRFRKEHPSLSSSTFLTSTDITWHDRHSHTPSWDSDNHLVGWSLQQDQIYIIFSSSHSPEKILLPEPPANHIWIDHATKLPVARSITLLPYSSLLLEATPQN